MGRASRRRLRDGAFGGNARTFPSGRRGGWAGRPRSGSAMRSPKVCSQMTVRPSSAAAVKVAASAVIGMRRPGVEKSSAKRAAKASQRRYAQAASCWATRGKSFQVRPSRMRPVVFLKTPPHCLKKKAVPLATHWSRISRTHASFIARASARIPHRQLPSRSQQGLSPASGQAAARWRETSPLHGPTQKVDSLNDVRIFDADSHPDIV